MAKIVVTNNDIVAAQREVYEGNMYAFLQGAWDTVEPSESFLPNWHIRSICDHLKAVRDGQIRRLVINIPPRHAKSLTSSVCFLPWLWTLSPGKKLMNLSTDGKLSQRDAAKCRRLIQSPWYSSMWPHVQLIDDSNQIMRFLNTKGGFRFSTSFDGGVIGEGADVIVGDDPHKIQDIGSDREREKVAEFWLSTAPTRLNDPKTGSMILIMQRLHQSDCTAACLKAGGWEHLCLPAEYEPERKCVTSIGFSDPRKVEGELLWPERMGQREIDEAKKRMKSEYAGQYQQRPSPKGGSLFKRKWFRYWENGGDGMYFNLNHPSGSMVQVKKEDCYVFGVLDPADSDDDRSAEACYSVLQIWAKTPHQDLILLDQYRKKVSIPDLGDDVVAFVARHKPQYVCVEKNGLGRHVIKDLQRRGVTIKPIVASKSKEERSEAAQSRMLSGQIYFPDGAGFLLDLEEELEYFPRSEFFDQVDCVAHASIFVQLISTEFDADSLDELAPVGDSGKDMLESAGGASPVSPVWSSDPSTSWQCHVVW